MFNSDNDDFSEEFGKVDNKRLKTDFKPWHKPRKQWVREFQWWKSFEEVYKRNSTHFREDEPIRYFGLPGGELLDVDYMSSMMEESDELKKMKLFVHGITSNNDDKVAADIRLSKLLDRSTIDSRSKVDRFRFESLKIPDSVLWNKIKAVTPYHIINLDFCEKVFQEDTIDSLHRLLKLQFSTLGEKPWLLCVTTRIDEKGDNDDILIRLNNRLQELSEEELDEYKLRTYFSDAFNAILSKINMVDCKGSLQLFIELYIIGFVIWLITLCQSESVQLKLKSSIKYSISSCSEHEDMYSFVFELKKSVDASSDPSKVANVVTARSDAINYSQMKDNLISKLSKTENLDDYLLSNDKEKERLIHTMKQLLSKAGYDTSSYEDFCG